MDKDAAKLLAVINNIEEQGIAIAQRQKWIKKLESNLYEIRAKYSSNIQREFKSAFKDIAKLMQSYTKDYIYYFHPKTKKERSFSALLYRYGQVTN